MRKRAARLLWLALLAGLLARSLGASDVFVRGPQGRTDVFLQRADSSYHARRALYSMERFPAVLTLDRYMAHPGGAVVPMPPLYDWALGGAARLLFGNQRGFELLAAWVSPVLGTLAALPVAWLAALLGGPGAALLAAWIYALLPIACQWQQIGDADHHAAVALLGALLLALSAHFAAPLASRRRLALLAAGLFAARSAMLASWSGSLLYLGVGELAVAVACLAGGRCARLGLHALSLSASAGVAAAVVAATPTPGGGPFSTTMLSWTHVVALGAGAASAALIALGERLRPSARAGERWLRAGLSAGLVAGLALARFPALLDALLPGAGFLAGHDTWAERNPEQFPLLGFIRTPGYERPLFDLGHQLWGGFLYLIPLAPLAALWRAREPSLRGPALGLAVFAAGFGVLAVFQVRFGNDFAPAAAVAFGLLLDALRRRASPRLGPRAAAWLCGAAAALLILPAALRSLLPAARVDLARTGLLELPEAPHDRTGHALIRFARRIRQVTPETSGYFDPGLRPEYGILCNPGHGGVVIYAARRPVPANNFGPYLDFEKYRLAVDFFGRAKSEEEGLAIAAKLDARYVLSFDYSSLSPASFAYQLHRLDGSERAGAHAAQHFRLVIESDPGDRPLWSEFPEGLPGYRVVPYKLFERVAGVPLEVQAAAGARVSARLPLRAPSGRSFVYRQTALADPGGHAHLVLPYASDRAAAHPEVTGAEGPYRIESGGRSAELEVAEAEVRSGGVRRLVLP